MCLTATVTAVIHSGGTDLVAPNPKWFPFNSSLNQVYTICSRFYEFQFEDGEAASNPFRMLKKSSRFNDETFEAASERALTPLQWNYVLETAERMAAEDSI